MLFRRVFPSLFLLFLVSFCFAQPGSIIDSAFARTLALNHSAGPFARVSKTWTGTVDTNWGTAGNWNPSGVPAAGDDVTIPNVVNQPTVNVVSTIHGLTINAGATLTLVSSLTVIGDLTNNGTLHCSNSGFAFNGTGTTVTNNGTITGGLFGFRSFGIKYVAGTGMWTLGSLFIENNATVTLVSNVNMEVPNFLVNIGGGGALDLGGFTATLTDTGMLANFDSIVSNGTLRLQGTSLINVLTPYFTAAVHVDTGTLTTRSAGTFGGNITIDPGATFRLEQTDIVHTGDLTNNGTLAFSLSSFSFNGVGKTVTNNGSIVGRDFRFQTPGAKYLGGTGSITTETAVGINNGASVTLTGDQQISGLGVGGTLNINDHMLTLFGAGAPLVLSPSGTLNFTGSGGLILGGDVQNNGSIAINGGDSGCGSATKILLRSSIAGTQRNWNGSGLFSMTDVDVKDQAGTSAITALGGVNSGNNGGNWRFTSCLACQFDFDGDGRADISVTRPDSAYVWYQLLGPNYTFTQTTFGQTGDIVTPADFDGDGITDLAIYRAGDWWWRGSINGQHQSAHWGGSGDIPLPGDIDGDGKADFVVYRNGTWYRLVNGQPTQMNLAFGAAGDKPLLADFDGDGKADPAIFRPSTGTFWYAASSAGDAHRGVEWGVSTDVPCPADYDGDGTTDFAVYRAFQGAWYILNSSNGSFVGLQFGVAEDRPIPADYDGDGNADVAVYRPSTGVWYILGSTSGFTGFQWGIATDIPSPAAYIPE